MTNILLRHLRRWVAIQADGSAPDRQLIERLAGQPDQAAFVAIMQRHGPMVLRLCRRLLNDDHEAEDAFQATFLVLARKVPTLGERTSIAPWLYGVAYKVASRIRAGGVRRHELDREPVDCGNQDPASAASWREVCATLDEEVHNLPAKLQAPLILCYLQGLTRDEAAQQLGWSLGTLKRRLEEGREVLRGRLVRRGVQFSAVLAVLEMTASPVPAALATATTQAALQLIAGNTLTAGAVSARAISLVDEVLKTTLSGPYRVLAAVVLTIGILGTAVGLDSLGSVATPSSGGGDAEFRGAAVQPVANAERLPGTDPNGDPLPQGAVARLGTVRWRQSGSVHAFAFSPDGRLTAIAATGVSFFGVSLRETATGKELAWFPEVDASRGDSIAFLPDGKSFAVGCSSQIVLIDVATRKITRPFKALQGHSAGGIALTADGKLLAAGSQNTGIFRIWETATGNEQFQLPVEDADRYGDGKHQFLDLESLRFSANGKVLLAVPERDRLAKPEEPRFLYRGEVANGQKLHKIALDTQDGFSSALVLAPDGSSLAGGNKNGTVRLLDTTTGKELRRFESRSGAIAAVAFSNDGKVLIAQGRESVVCFWDVATGKEIRQFVSPAPVGDRPYETALVVSPDGRILARRDSTHVLRLWDAATGKELQDYQGHRKYVQALAFSRDGQRLASVGPEDVCLWDRTTGQELAHMRAESNRHFWPAVAVDPDGGDVVAASSALDAQGNQVVYRWQTPSGKELQRRTLEQTPERMSPHRHTISPDGHVVLARKLEESALSLWNSATGQEICQLQRALGHVQMSAFAPDGRALALAATERGPGPHLPTKLCLYSMTTGKPLFEFAGPKPVASLRINCGVFAPDSRTLATAGSERLAKGTSEGFIRLWETATGKERFQWRTHQSTAVAYVSAVAFSPDGKVLASAGDDNVIRLWDCTTGKELCRFQGHRGRALTLAFAPDGRTLASGGDDTTILIWDTADIANKLAPPVVERTQQELEALWVALMGDDAGKAYEAMVGWQASPKQAASWFADRVQAVAPVPPTRLRQLLADLESKQFPVREKATQELTQLAELAEQELRRVLESKPSLETQQRVEKILENVMTRQVSSAEALRALRAIEVLERIATPEARRILEKLSQGAPVARLTVEAKASLDRLGTR